MMIFPQKCGILNETPVRKRLKEEITTLTDRQAEYVLRRMQNERKMKELVGLLVAMIVSSNVWLWINL